MWWAESIFPCDIEWQTEENGENAEAERAIDWKIETKSDKNGGNSRQQL